MKSNSSKILEELVLIILNFIAFLNLLINLSGERPK
jgi:hypothetical protein